jgi:hypothetical protein
LPVRLFFDLTPPDSSRHAIFQQAKDKSGFLLINRYLQEW